MIYDITRHIQPNTVAWPGVSSYQVETLVAIEQGASVNLTSLTISPHVGTHADAYYHYETHGAHPAQMDITPYIGRARVVTVDKHDGALTPADFQHVDLTGAERLLIHSHVSDLPDHQWAEQFPYLSVELIGYLVEKGVILIGLDSPSVDDFHSKTLPCHHAIFQHRMANLELLNLRGVPDGDYELIALPLKLDLACGSPVRAILRTLS
jgi:arylformamidase